jgi:hypothetical protein
MSAVPKRADAEFWMENSAGADAIPMPREWAPRVAGTIEIPHVKPREAAREFQLPKIPLLEILSRFELAISIIAMVALAGAVASMSHSRQEANIEARETRIAISNLRKEIGDLNNQLEMLNNVDDETQLMWQLGTIPIDADEVPVIRLQSMYE